MKLSDHFTLEELLHSDEAIKNGILNVAGEKELNNLQLLVSNILEPARKNLDAPIFVNSGYRNKMVNFLPSVGGSKNSYHLKGMAADITTRSAKRDKELLEILKKLPYTELIAYRRKQTGNIMWIHVAFNPYANSRTSYSVYK